MALPLSYILGILLGIIISSIFIGGIIAMLYFLWYQRRVVKKIPEQMKGGDKHNDNKVKEEGRGGAEGGEGRGGEGTTSGRDGDSKDSTDENDDGFKHRIQVQPTLPYPEVERESRSSNEKPKRDWPSFS